jgi:hypothetical protein
MAARKLVVEVSGYAGGNYDNVWLILKPRGHGGQESPTVVSYGNTGGTPEMVYNGRHRHVLSYNKDVHGPDVQRWVEEHSEKFLRLASCYLGSEWDGSNVVGNWDEANARALEEALESELQADICDGAVRSYWRAADYYEWSKAELIERVLLEAKDLDDFARKEAEEAKDDPGCSVLLDADDVKDYFEGLLLNVDEDDPNYSKAQELLYGSDNA